MQTIRNIDKKYDRFDFTINSRTTNQLQNSSQES